MTEPGPTDGGRVTPMSRSIRAEVAVLDYGSGNLHSAVHALSAVGARVTVVRDCDAAMRAPALVVPGVGAFAACMTGLIALGGDDMIRRRVAAGRPLLGICVGHQVLFASGVEHGQRTAGVGVYPGAVERVPARRLPHMGWNQVRPGSGSTLFDQERRYYFVHSYAALTAADLPEDATCSWTTHDGVDLIAAVEWGPVASCQFHPEKSGQAGLALLRRWLDQVEAR